MGYSYLGVALGFEESDAASRRSVNAIFNALRLLNGNLSTTTAAAAGLGSGGARGLDTAEGAQVSVAAATAALRASLSPATWSPQVRE